MLLQLQLLVFAFLSLGYGISLGTVDAAKEVEAAMKNAEAAIAAAEQAAAIQPAMDNTSARDVLEGSIASVDNGSDNGTDQELVDAAKQVETAMKITEAAVAAAEQAAAVQPAADTTSGAPTRDALEGIMIGIKAGAALHAVHHAAVLQAAIEAQAAKPRKL